MKLTPKEQAELERDFEATWQKNLLSWLVSAVLAVAALGTVAMLFEVFNRGGC